MKKLGFGLMRLPIIGGDHSNIDIEAVKRMVDEFISRGFCNTHLNHTQAKRM